MVCRGDRKYGDEPAPITVVSEHPADIAPDIAFEHPGAVPHASGVSTAAANRSVLIVVAPMVGSQYCVAHATSWLGVVWMDPVQNTRRLTAFELAIFDRMF